ncbi:bifunctional glycosyltransferase/CDP-glycerol:glycerophosphate glycerophosphotransferase [Brevibacterium sp. UCMA 11752]|uniref:bifunctional glycosyltransferase/CDP-glycerol:glycerophosphate glycerophosphotransferase n=1 Tax=Brevibacterium sp. UCMA 11752 TaxID=2745946 RepID=UPI001F301304|nr:CDP-glycerol glycerophosphotransferase family protein [Brevibacterium sp. UCMA 11752]MCF2585821.1 CDP-glycerol glycerophosphotransferase family protein [Brevibacterium sp. UCMA 11752]
MRPTFSVIIAIYEVEQYIDAFLRSLDAQTYPIDKIEIVAVNDGSTDSSASIFEAWMSGRDNVSLIHQENCGAAAARAVALERVSGEWVTVADPDDILDPEYFSSVESFILRDEENLSSILSTRVYILNDETGEYRDSHPLAKKFKFGERIADLDEEPEAFQLGATAFFKLNHLRENDLNYDTAIRPTFEDAHLIGRYLDLFNRPMVGLVSKAIYYYRKRAAQNSLVQSSWSTSDRFLNTPRRGYLDLLNKVGRRGQVPKWAQYMVLYDLLWYFKEDQVMVSKVAWIDSATRREFLDLLEEIMRRIDSSTIEEFSCNPHPWALRESIRLRYGKTPQDKVALYRWNSDKYGRAKITFIYSGTRPYTEFYADGAVTEPVEHDYTTHRLFGEAFAVEESLTLEGSEITVFSNGTMLRSRKFSNPKWPAPSSESASRVKQNVTAAQIGRTRSQAQKIRSRVRVKSLTTRRSAARVVFDKTVQATRRSLSSARQQTESGRVIRTVQNSKLPEVQRRYSNAWLVMDRPDKADDNGEHLYRYLMKERPDINAFFVLSKASKDWPRLSTEGFRMLEYGSEELYLAALNGSFRISSDATADVMYPAPRELFGSPKGKFVFLQHGVTKDDLSRWLNPKQIDLLITASRDEYTSFIGPGSPYKIRSGNVALTGFSRYDRLLEISRRSSRESILIMPTWRAHIRDELLGYSSAERNAVFGQTLYGRQWLDLLKSEDLRLLAESKGLSIEFVVHPSLSNLLPKLSLPPHVARVDLSSNSFQETLARASVFVTDYSSVAFDAAYIDIPSVYFQFDSEAVFSGGHNYRKGYYNYDDAGFGPVVSSVSSVVGSVERLLTDRKVRDHFLDRALSVFYLRDFSNSERIVQAIEDV